MSEEMHELQKNGHEREVFSLAEPENGDQDAIGERDKLPVKNQAPVGETGAVKVNGEGKVKGKTIWPGEIGGMVHVGVVVQKVMKELEQARGRRLTQEPHSSGQPNLIATESQLNFQGE